VTSWNDGTLQDWPGGRGRIPSPGPAVRARHNFFLTFSLLGIPEFCHLTHEKEEDRSCTPPLQVCVVLNEEFWRLSHFCWFEIMVQEGGERAVEGGRTGRTGGESGGRILVPRGSLVGGQRRKNRPPEAACAGREAAPLTNPKVQSANEGPRSVPDVFVSKQGGLKVNIIAPLPDFATSTRRRPRLPAKAEKTYVGGLSALKEGWLTPFF
jgi:hypothetical protein